MPLAISSGCVQQESYRDVHSNPDISHEQKDQVLSLFKEFSSIFSDIPGCTDLVTHDIEITDTKPSFIPDTTCSA